MPGPRIRRSRRRLSEATETEIQRIIRTELPADGGLWTKAKTHALIKETTGLDLPERTYGTYLERWGFQPMKLLRRAYRQDPMTMKAWMTRDYPAIAMMARNDGAEVLWISLEKLPALVTPADGILMAPGEHLLIASTNRGHLDWMVLRLGMDSNSFHFFVNKLLDHYGSIEAIVLHDLLVTEPDADGPSYPRVKGLMIHRLPKLHRPAPRER